MEGQLEKDPRQELEEHFASEAWRARRHRVRARIPLRVCAQGNSRARLGGIHKNNSFSVRVG